MHLVLREVGLRGRFTGKDVSGTLYNLGSYLSEYPYYSVSPLGLISGLPLLHRRHRRHNHGTNRRPLPC